MSDANAELHSVILVEATGDPAFAVDAQGRIIAWNSAVEVLLGHSAQAVVGRPCAEVLCGRDVFGNLYCDTLCNPRQLMARHDTVNSFELQVPTAAGDSVCVHVFSVLVQDASAAEFTVAHLLWPASESRRQPGANPARAPAQLEGGRMEVPTEAPALTPREVEVLRHLADGHSVAAIASLLCVSASTIRSHVQNTRRKCGVHNVRAAIAVATQHGLI